MCSGYSETTESAKMWQEKVMLKCRIRLITLAAILALTAFSAASADTWRLSRDEDWKTLSAQGDDKFLIAAANAKSLVDTGQTEAARQAYEKLKNDPAIIGIDHNDLDAFIAAEMLYSQGKFAKAYRRYEKLLRDFPRTKLQNAALERQFAIGTAYLGGQKKVVLKVIPLKGDAEGIRIMEKIIEHPHVGVDSPLGLRASKAIVQNYLKRRLYDDAYFKWLEVSAYYKTDPTAKEALLGMAQCYRATYNKHPEKKRHFYDTSKLTSAKTYYQSFQVKYPDDAEKVGVNRILTEMDEQLARKQLAIAQYYQRTGNRQAANFYFDVVMKDWPHTKVAGVANQLRNKSLNTSEKDK